MIKEKYIDLVKSRVDICQLVVDVCPGTVLKKAGRYRKKCKCVFHKEDTPSMLLDSTTNLYYCFARKVAMSLRLSRKAKGLNLMVRCAIFWTCIVQT